MEDNSIILSVLKGDKAMAIKNCFFTIIFLSAGLVFGQRYIQYPLLNHRMSPESHIPQICEKNEMRWFPDKNVIKSCENLNGFPNVAQLIKDVKFSTTGKSLTFERRQSLLKIMQTTDFMTSLYKDVYPIFKGQSMTAEERNQEMDYVLEYILKAAEEENQKTI